MLIVGGTAALTAIAAYLAWHFLHRWLATLRLRSAKSDPAHRPCQEDTASPHETRELMP